MKQLWIVQPYVPSYRVPFFERLAVCLAKDDIDLRVVAGQPKGAQAQRGDAQSPDWLVHAKDREIRVFGRTVTLTSTRAYWGKSDAVIVPLMGSSLDALSATFAKCGIRVGVWGHIASYTAKANPIDAAIERQQLRRADEVFAYTPGGAQFAYAAGVDHSRVTTVMNATDTMELTRDIESLSADDIAEFRAGHGIAEDAPLVAYIGGLDASKRIEFLARALDALAERQSAVHVVVGGTGVDEQLLRSAAARGQVTMLGRITGSRKAAVLGACSALVNPGRVGLVAVEALAVGLPVLTTEFPYHAPEAEYLQEGTTRFTSPDDPVLFAELIDKHARIARPSRSSPHPTLHQMVSNFSIGARRLVDAR